MNRCFGSFFILAIAPAIEKYSTGKPVIDSLIAFGVLGIITLHSGIYVMVIKRRILVGLMDGHTIYKIAEPAIFRVSNKGSKDARDDSDSTSAQSSSSKGDGADKVRSKRRNFDWQQHSLHSLFLAPVDLVVD